MFYRAVHSLAVATAHLAVRAIGSFLSHASLKMDVLVIDAVSTRGWPEWGSEIFHDAQHRFIPARWPGLHDDAGGPCYERSSRQLDACGRQQ